MTSSPPVDVIVPYGHCEQQPERKANLAHVIALLANDLNYHDRRVILAELGPTPTARHLAHEHGVDYVFTRDDGEFSPGKAMNAGFLGREAPRDLVYFHQADFLVPRGVLSWAVRRLDELDCPFVYPYWGEVHLSKPVSAAVRADQRRGSPILEQLGECIPRWRATWGALPEPPTGATYDEIVLSDPETHSLEALLDPLVRQTIGDGDQEHLWGLDDREYAPYRWRDSDAAAARICRISGGPRASAAYLCTDEAFRRVGGVPVLPGWGYEDLMLWLTVQAVYPFAGDRRAITYAGHDVTGQRFPLVHLWHPVAGRDAYYAATRENESRFIHFRGLDYEQRRASLRPLPARQRPLVDSQQP